MTIHSNPKLTTCPDCGLALPKNAPAGLCPACLLRAVMGSESETGRTNDADPPDHPPAMETTSAVIERGAAQRGNSTTTQDASLSSATLRQTPSE